MYNERTRPYVDTWFKGEEFLHQKLFPRQKVAIYDFYTWIPAEPMQYLHSAFGKTVLDVVDIRDHYKLGVYNLTDPDNFCFKLPSKVRLMSTAGTYPVEPTEK